MKRRWAVMVAIATLLGLAGSPAQAGQIEDACSLLNTGEVASALGESVEGGKIVSTRTCEWKSSASDKIVLLTVFGTMGKLTPADRFEISKTPVTGIEKTPVNGVGDEAVLILTARHPALNVRSRDAVFQVRVSGSRVPEEKLEQIERALAQQAVRRL